MTCHFFYFPGNIRQKKYENTRYQSDTNQSERVFQLIPNYSFDSLVISNSLKNKLNIIATIVANPIPFNSTCPMAIVVPLIPMTRTTHVNIKFFALL